MPEEINLEEKKSSRELWLFFIFIDLLALAVFGYFIYNAFVGENSKSVKVIGIPQTEELVLEEVEVEDVKTPVKNDVKEEIKTVEQKEEPVKVQEEKVAAITDAPKPSEENINTKPITKQSYEISGTGKWRRVTFKYFDNAKSVSIVSGFTMTKPVALKKVQGVWQVTLTIAPDTYKYLFIVNGKEMQDPLNPTTDEGKSVIVIK